MELWATMHALELPPELTRLIAANGRFEVTGLAQPYMNYATLTRTLRWMGATAEAPAVTRVAAKRDRKPDDNRRVRNRI